jgi:hypothetical protein
LAEQLRSRHVGVKALSKPELEDYWLMSPALAHAILVGLAREASAKRREDIPAPSAERVKGFLITPRAPTRASDILEQLCNEQGLRWSKELAARIAITCIDDLAPEVAQAIAADLDAAIAAAEPMST